MKKFKFSPYQKVLVRNNDEELWAARLYDQSIFGVNYCQDGKSYSQMVSFEDHEAYYGTTIKIVDPDKFQDGDILVSGWEDLRYKCSWVFILKGKWNKKRTEEYCGTYIYCDSPLAKGQPKTWVSGSHEVDRWTRFATKKEKALLMSRLKDERKTWNHKSKVVENLPVFEASAKKYEPKDGDFVYVKDEDSFPMIALYKGHSDGSILAYASYFPKTGEFYDSSNLYMCPLRTVKELRLATNEERALLLYHSEIHHKRWNAEKFELEDWTFRPQLHEEYFSPAFENGAGWSPMKYRFSNDGVDAWMREREFMYSSDEVCQVKCNLLNKSLFPNKGKC